MTETTPAQAPAPATPAAPVKTPSIWDLYSLAIVRMVCLIIIAIASVVTAFVLVRWSIAIDGAVSKLQQLSNLTNPFGQ